MMQSYARRDAMDSVPRTPKLNPLATSFTPREPVWMGTKRLPEASEYKDVLKTTMNDNIYINTTNDKLNNWKISYKGQSRLNLYTKPILNNLPGLCTVRNPGLAGIKSTSNILNSTIVGPMNITGSTLSSNSNGSGTGHIEMGSREALIKDTALNNISKLSPIVSVNTAETKSGVKFYTPNPVASSGMIAYVNTRFCVVTRRDAQLLELLAVQRPLPKEYKNACQYCFKRSSRACWHNFKDHLKRIICPLVGYKLSILQSYRKKNPNYQMMRQYNRKMSVKSQEQAAAESEQVWNSSQNDISRELPYKRSPSETSDTSVWEEFCSESFEAEYQKKLQASEIVYNNKSPCEVLSYMPISERIASRSFRGVSSQWQSKDSSQSCTSNDKTSVSQLSEFSQDINTSATQSVGKDDYKSKDILDVAQNINEAVEAILSSDESSLSQISTNHGSSFSSSVLNEPVIINKSSLHQNNLQDSMYREQKQTRLKVKVPPVFYDKPLVAMLMKVAVKKMKMGENFLLNFIRGIENTLISIVEKTASTEVHTSGSSPILESLVIKYNEKASKVVHYVKDKKSLCSSKVNLVKLAYNLVKNFDFSLGYRYEKAFSRSFYWTDLEKLLAGISCDNKKLTSEFTDQIAKFETNEIPLRKPGKEKFSDCNFLIMMDMTKDDEEMLTFRVIRMCEKISGNYTKMIKIASGDLENKFSLLEEYESKFADKIRDVKVLFGDPKLLINGQNSDYKSTEHDEECLLDDNNNNENYKNLNLDNNIAAQEGKDSGNESDENNLVSENKAELLIKKYAENKKFVEEAKEFAIKFIVESYLYKVKVLDYFLDNANMLLENYESLSFSASELSLNKFDINCNRKNLVDVMDEVDIKIFDENEQFKESKTWQKPNVYFLSEAQKIWSNPAKSNGIYSLWN